MTGRDGCLMLTVGRKGRHPSRGQREADKGGWRRSGGRAGSQLVYFFLSYISNTHTRARALIRTKHDGSRETDETGTGNKWERKREGGDRLTEAVTRLILLPGTVERSGNDEAIVSIDCVSAAQLIQSAVQGRHDEFITRNPGGKFAGY